MRVVLEHFVHDEAPQLGFHYLSVLFLDSYENLEGGEDYSAARKVVENLVSIEELPSLRRLDLFQVALDVAVGAIDKVFVDVLLLEGLHIEEAQLISFQKDEQCFFRDVLRELL